jgi:hypothetical protein
MLVDGVSLGSIGCCTGAQGDAMQIIIGFGAGLSPGPGTSDVYHVKVSRGDVVTNEFTEVTLGDVMAMEFQSVQGTEYRLESTDQVATNWQFAGMILIGDGDVMHMYDPAGISALKAYRIVVP